MEKEKEKEKDKYTVALVAHDNMKADLAEWVDENWEVLHKCDIVCTGTTGRMVEEKLKVRLFEENVGMKGLKSGLRIKRLKSGPLGGDQQMGALIAVGKIDLLFFFWDPMQAQPHDVDVKALLRIATLYNVPIAVNRSTADFMITSPLFTNQYEREVKDYSDYINRVVKK